MSLMSNAKVLADQLLEADDPKDLLMRLADQSDAAASAGIIDRSTIGSIGYGTMIYHRKLRNNDGTPLRAKVTGKVKTWKRDPLRFEIPFKYGLYDYGKVTQDTAGEWSLSEEAAEVTESQRAKDLILSDEVVRGARNIEDLRQYVDSTMLDIMDSDVVTPENVEKVMGNLPDPSKGWPDVRRVIAAIAEAGLGNLDELEYGFRVQEGIAKSVYRTP